MKSKIKQFYGSVKNKAAVAGAATLGLVQAAQAAVPADVTTTLDGAKTDVGTIGVAVFGIAVAIVLFKWFKKAL